jgi:uncharacterized protein YecE (DUF72 family)
MLVWPRIAARVGRLMSAAARSSFYYQPEISARAATPRASEIFEKFDPITADFTYVRPKSDRKGIEQKTKVWDKVIVGRSRELMSWVNVCQRTIRRGVSTYVYVNNHYAGFAPATVERFQKLWKTASR